MALLQEANLWGGRIPRSEWQMGYSHRTKEEWREDKFELGKLRDQVNDLLVFGGTRTYPKSLLGKAFRLLGAVTIGPIEALNSGVTPLQAMDKIVLSQQVEDETGEARRVSIASYHAVPERSDWIRLTIEGHPTHLQLREDWGQVFENTGSFLDRSVKFATSEDARKYQELLGFVQAKLEQSRLEQSRTRAEAFGNTLTISSSSTRGPILDRQRHAISEFFTFAAKELESIPSHPFVERVGAAVINLGGAAISLDGLKNTTIAFTSKEPKLEDMVLSTAEVVLGATVIAVADTVKKWTWRREKKNSG